MSGSEPSEMRRVDRRDFLAQCAKAAAGAGLLFYGVHVTASVAGDSKEKKGKAASPYNPQDHYYGMVINISKCIGCYSCMRACATENDIGDRGFRTWVERYTLCKTHGVTIKAPEPARNGNDARGFFKVPEDTEKGCARERFFVPKLCNHCENPPCTQVCPVGATFQTKDGVVVIDHDSCVGCAYCIQACPYGARFWDEKFLCANKCDFCYHRITKGLSPACVQACPTGARIFGDLKDPKSPIYEALHKEKATMLKRQLGTKPKVYYTDIHKEIV